MANEEAEGGHYFCCVTKTVLTQWDASLWLSLPSAGGMGGRERIRGPAAETSGRLVTYSGDAKTFGNQKALENLDPSLWVCSKKAGVVKWQLSPLANFTWDSPLQGFRAYISLI